MGRTPPSSPAGPGAAPTSTSPDSRRVRSGPARPSGPARASAHPALTPAGRRRQDAWMGTGLAPVELARSAAWDEPSVPRVAVVVATFNRARFLPELVAALEVQTLPLQDFEVVVADNASVDDTSDVLRRLTAGTPL